MNILEWLFFLINTFLGGGEGGGEREEEERWEVRQEIKLLIRLTFLQIARIWKQKTALSMTTLKSFTCL